MCSIAAVSAAGSKAPAGSAAASAVCSLLENMTYRGYDSIGMAASDGIITKTYKTLGTDFEKIRVADGMRVASAIGQTRWATHGSNTLVNANPQVSLDENDMPAVSAVMNGIISNYDDIRQDLQSSFEFASENDTEAAAHAANLSNFDMQKTTRLLSGRYTCIAMSRGGRIGFIRGGPSLITGMYHDENGVGMRCLASDIHAMAAIGITRIAVIPAGSFGYASASGISVFDIQTGRALRLSYEDIPLPRATQKPPGGITEAELGEAANIASVGAAGLADSTTYAIKKAASIIKSAQSQRVVFCGSGSSFHMASLGACLLSGSSAKPACELICEDVDVAGDGLNDVMVAISQSGESGDILQAVESARHSTKSVISITNNPYSTLASMSDVTLEMGCGPEQGVAATKSVISTALILQRLLDDSVMSAVRFSDAVSESSLDKAAVLVAKSTDVYMLGSGIYYVPAMEGALKLKELAYLHAEACFAGEFKHGPLAVLESKNIVIIIDPNGRHADLSDEIRARGGRTILLSRTKAYKSDLWIKLEPVTEGGIHGHVLQCILAVQAIAIKAARIAGMPVDRPRHLAKCVSV
ncbi:MAG: SIS domain-containing protein [Cenarchaeum sp. SB0665_bin_23]|nr:SIS domain-containing protein [Cenarchaeum sp. SB0667_bin_13]MXY60898.1 SIS domain-containing protein [Cenarchaeum sp. SB0665_bin_23]MXZ93043.1 SIS domain-containing protein [Cenarchaeum sp. SB0666_bin_15]MYC80097.1 SIS domain-containing protein [Cenarchaeum sp. SB0661_bin_35]MYD58610.1 SIS domain-containing protein [Cenarchaeum sp. SB0678_bin_8]MYG32457.1 SIS domain-containing protein [Cenarchaeum sp. SB0677_bin_16]